MLIPWVLNEKKPLSILKKERLTAGDMLQVRKVAKHVYEKLFLNENDKEYDDDYLTDVSLTVSSQRLIAQSMISSSNVDD